MNSPFLTSSYNTKDLGNAFRHLRSEIETALDLIEKHENSSSDQTEAAMLLKLYGLEAQMSNIATDLRRFMV